ncbi:MAG: hypothetical protein ACFFD4_21135 [Candidatus Odinarchaeota archaeon]
MKKTIITYLSFSLLLFVCITPIVASSGHNYYNEVVGVEIFDAYYCDSDGDSEYDDIEAIVTMEFSISSDCNGSRENYVIQDDGVFYIVDSDYYLVIVKLTLPSGLTYSYSFQNNIIKGSVSYQFFFYNHATESGDYILSVGVYSSHDSYESDNLTFDPPKGIPGTEPTFAFLML